MAQVHINITIWHTNLRDVYSNLICDLNNIFKTAVVCSSGSLRP